jgi:methionine-rich copper-binding protein CopC
MTFWRPAAPAIAVLLLCVIHRTDAHAILLSATPALRQIVSGPDLPVSLRFNSRIDGRRSRLVLVGPNSEERNLDIDAQPSPDTLTARIKGLASGSYILRWQVLANDGHITRGEVPFRVR